MKTLLIVALLAGAALAEDAKPDPAKTVEQQKAQIAHLQEAVKDLQQKLEEAQGRNTSLSVYLNTGIDQLSACVTKLNQATAKPKATQ